MPEPHETSWCLQRGIGTARVIVDLVGDHVNELPDPICLGFAAQLLDSIAEEQGVEDVQHLLWWIETMHAHTGVVVAKTEDEARARWLEAHPVPAIRKITGGDGTVAFI